MLQCICQKIYLKKIWFPFNMISINLVLSLGKTIKPARTVERQLCSEVWTLACRRHWPQTGRMLCTSQASLAWGPLPTMAETEIQRFFIIVERLLTLDLQSISYMYRLENEFKYNIFQVKIIYYTSRIKGRIIIYYLAKNNNDTK